MDLIKNLIEEARTYKGVKWVHQGRTKKGVDCVGFLILALRTVGVKVIEIKGYGRNPDGGKLKQVMDAQPRFSRVNKRDLIPGDIILLRIRREPQHVAMITGMGHSKLGMIHSYNGGEKKVVEHDFVDYWSKKIIAAYRIDQ